MTTATVIYIEEFNEPTVFDIETPFSIVQSDETILDWIFQQLQHIYGNEWIACKKLRSMSVGDMVYLHGNTFVCCRIGWKHISKMDKISV